MVTRSREREERESSLGEQTSKVMRDVRELGSIAVDSATSAAGRLKERGREVVAAGRERVAGMETELERYVARHPIKSLLFAVGVGAFLGLTMRRRG